MTSSTVSAAGPVAAAKRLIRRRVWGHSVIATRIVVPTSSARLTLNRLPGVRGYPSGLTLGHGARRGNDCPRIAAGPLVGAIAVQWSVPLMWPCHSHKHRYDCGRTGVAMRETVLEAAVPAGVDLV